MLLTSALHLRRGALGLLVAALLALTGPACLEIDVAGDWIAPVPGIPDPPADAPIVQLRLSGAGMWADDWARALTISRFFYSSIENQSGSPARLLEPGLRELLRQQGYRVASEVLRDSAELPAPAELRSTSDSLELHLEFERNILLWLPPREFIQTPKARARGTVRVDLATYQRLSRTGGGPELWKQSFEFEDELRVLPGQESAGLAQGAASAFENYLRYLQINIPRAGALPASGVEGQP